MPIEYFLLRIKSMAQSQYSVPSGNIMSNITSLKDVGKILRAKRNEMGLSQQALAIQANVGNRIIGEIEAGKPTCQFDKVAHVMQQVGLQLRVVTTNQG